VLVVRVLVSTCSTYHSVAWSMFPSFPWVPPREKKTLMLSSLLVALTASSLLAALAAPPSLFPDALPLLLLEALPPELVLVASPGEGLAADPISNMLVYQ
jgi:hypothetical protein